MQLNRPRPENKRMPSISDIGTGKATTAED